MGLIFLFERILKIITCSNELPSKVTTCLCDELPRIDPKYILGSFGFVFDSEKRILLTKLKKRGWDIPG